MNMVLGIIMLIALILLPFAFLLFGLIVLKILPFVVIVITSIYFYQKNNLEKRRRKDLLKARDEIFQNKSISEHREE
jgi:hypothetical protein